MTTSIRWLAIIAWIIFGISMTAEYAYPDLFLGLVSAVVIAAGVTILLPKSDR